MGGSQKKAPPELAYRSIKEAEKMKSRRVPTRDQAIDPQVQEVGRVLAYLRVSTDEQDVNAQKVGVVDYAHARNLVINEWCKETASGGLSASDRVLGRELLPKLRPGDQLIVPELSRL